MRICEKPLIFLDWFCKDLNRSGSVKLHARRRMICSTWPSKGAVGSSWPGSWHSVACRESVSASGVSARWPGPASGRSSRGPGPGSGRSRRFFAVSRSLGAKRS